MPDTTEAQVLGRLDELIEIGHRLVKLYGVPIMRAQWEAQSAALMEQVLPATHAFRKAWDSAESNYPKLSIPKRVGVLRGLREDVAGGYLSELRTSIVAEVFTDFLDLADHLLRGGPPLHVPAASVAGAVLEDALRRLCVTRGLPVDPKRSGINILNTACYKDGLYLVTEHKKVQVWADVRNNADHGHFDKVKEHDVADMLSGVRRFLGDHLK